MGTSKQITKDGMWVDTKNTRWFHDMTEMRDFVINTPTTKTGYISTEQDKGEWAGNVTLDEAAELAVTGWPEKRESAQEIASEITADAVQSVEHMVPSFRANYTGGSVNMGAYLSGQPKCMRQFTQSPEATATRVVTLHVSVCVSANIDADVMKRRGSVVAALCRVMEQTGRTVEIWVEATTQPGRRAMTTCTLLKRPDENLDMDQLLFAIAHPGSFRRLIFGAWERMPNPDDLGEGYGTPMKAQCADAVGATVVLDNANNNRPRECTDPVGWITDIVTQVTTQETVHDNR